MPPLEAPNDGHFHQQKCPGNFLAQCHWWRGYFDITNIQHVTCIIFCGAVLYWDWRCGSLETAKETPQWLISNNRVEVYHDLLRSYQQFLLIKGGLQTCNLESFLKLATFSFVFGSGKVFCLPPKKILENMIPLVQTFSKMGLPRHFRKSLFQIRTSDLDPFYILPLHILCTCYHVM